MTGPWPTIPFREAGTWLSGGTPAKSRADLWNGSVPWVSPKDMKVGRIAETIDHVSASAVGNGTKSVPPNTLLFVVRGMILAHTFPVAITTREVTFNQDMKAVLPSEKFDAEYLFYWLLSQAGAVLNKTAVSNHGTRRLPTEDLAAMAVPVPPRTEQRKIAAILSSVDEMIEKTEAVIEQLQVVRKAMMQELLTRGLPGRHTRFKNTEIGEIPEGWSLARLGTLLRERIRNGYSPRCPNHPTGKKILHLGAVTFDGFNPDAVKPAPQDDPKVDATLLQPGDVLISRSNTRERVGLAGVYRGTPAACSYPDLLMRVRTSDQLSSGFLESCLLSHRGRDYFQRSARGTSGSMVKVNRAIVEAFPLPLPPREEQDAIVDRISSVVTRGHAEETTLLSLRTLKESLMSALLTGELRITPDEEAA